MPSLPDIARVRAAASRIDPAFVATRVVSDAAFDDALGCRVLVKDETANPIGSFKGRGADWFVRVALRPREAVACASAGNFGLGLAWACARHGHACAVFVARGANPLKVDALRVSGAEVHVAGADFDAAKQAARAHARSLGLRYVEDGAEPAIAEGAGTIALELVAQAEFDAIVVPLGNGALLAGIGSVLRTLAPGVAVIGVVARNAPAMQRSLRAGRAVATPHAVTIADGIAVREPIAESIAALARCCDDVVDVAEDDLCSAIVLLHRHLRLVVEPAGAAGIAALVAEPGRYAGRRIATVACGAHIAPGLRARLLGAVPFLAGVHR